jgi:hypothetical protein
MLIDGYAIYRLYPMAPRLQYYLFEHGNGRTLKLRYPEMYFFVGNYLISMTLSHYGHALIIKLCSYNTYASDIIGSICHEVDNKGHEYVNNLNFASQYPFKHQSKRQIHKYSCYISLYFYFLTYTIITYISNAFLHISTYNY